MQLFGYEIKRREEKERQELKSFVPPSNEDGSLVVSEGGIYGTYVDLDGSIRTEAELVSKYRSIAMDPIVDMAIQDIVNECIVEDSQEPVVEIILDDLNISSGLKDKVIKEFDTVKHLIEFDNLSFEIFKRWYVDGRLYYHSIIDENKVRDGIKELRYIDPRNIKKVREVKKEKDQNGVTVERVTAEYYLYNKTGFLGKAGSTVQSQSPAASINHAQGVKIAKDSVIYCTSGYQNEDNNLILSYLHKVIRPFNQLRSMEDSLVIYRISRAPERRIFYVDVGGLPKIKAEQYLRDIMTKFKNKTVYDSSTGEIRDDRKFMTMLEDFWLPRREGSRGTEITTLPGGQNLGEIDDINYFKELLYRSLNVPITRLQSDNTFTLGRATEISRDEVKFSKFVARLRKKFSELFLKLLEQQLILKSICTPEDWTKWRNCITFKYAIDNYFEEMKSLEILRDRVNLLRDLEDLVGKYYSHEFVMKNILQMDDKEIKEQGRLIKKEQKDPRFAEEGLGQEEGGAEQPPANEPQPAQPQPSEKGVTDPKSEDEKEQTRDNKRDPLVRKK